MGALDSIINVQIDRQTTAVSKVGFGTALLLDQHTTIPDVAKEYASADELLDDGFTTSDNAYKAALAYFSQEKKPTKLLLGKRGADVAQVNTVDVATIANTTLYRVTLNGVNCDYTSDGTATGPEIQAGLVAAINASSQASVLTAAPGGGNTVVITSDTAGLGFSITVSANLTNVATTPNKNAATEVAAIRDLNDDWYLLLSTSHVEKDVLDLAAYIEGTEKQYGYSSEETDIPVSGSGDLASLLKLSNYFRTWGIYSTDSEKFPEAAWAGRLLPEDPGSETWAFKTLAGIATDNLTTNQINILDGKNINHYTLTAGVSIMRQGRVAAGEWIDVMRFVDWLKARMQERIYEQLVNLLKIPYTDQGVAIIENLVRAQLQEGIRVGGLAQDPAPTVTVPKVADISTTDKANRLLPDVKFDATLAGAIHKININGVVTV